MNRRSQSAVVLIIGAVTLRVSLSSAYLAYVRPGMRIPLVAAGLLLIVVGVLRWREPARASAGATGTGSADDGADAHDHDHDHGHGRSGSGPAWWKRRPHVAWLLLAPVAVLVVAPGPLGSSAARIHQSAQAPVSPGGSFSPLPAVPRGEPVALGVADFTRRGLYDPAGSVVGRPVRLSGFVMRERGREDTFLLVRFLLSCCAADGVPVRVRVSADAPPPADDSWVEVVGVLDEEAIERSEPYPLPVRATEVRPITQPSNPYETVRS